MTDAHEQQVTIRIGPETVEAKRCGSCGRTLQLNEFYPRSNGQGYRSACRTCANNQSQQLRKRRRQENPDRVREMTRAGYRRNRERILETARDYRIRKSYGMERDDFDRLAAAQDGRCAICQRLPRGKRGLVVDHDHATGIVRGLLCNHCNSGIGHLGDAAETVARALAYLQERS